MKKIIVFSCGEIHEFLADLVNYDSTLQVIKNHQVIAEFTSWEYWKYYHHYDSYGSDKMPC